jgi:hypothetical protein
VNLKNIGKVVTSKFFEIGPSFYKKKNLPGRGLTKVEKHCSTVVVSQPHGKLYATCSRGGCSDLQDLLYV